MIRIEKNKKNLNKFNKPNRKDNEKEGKMNLNDKRIFKALSFVSDNSIITIKSMKEKGSTDFDKYVPPDIENILREQRFISTRRSELPDPMFMITKKGNDHKHKLYQIHTKDWHRWGTIVNIIAGILNIYLFGKNIKWW